MRGVLRFGELHNRNALLGFWAPVWRTMTIVQFTVTKNQP
jgi:hypothetical protein